MTNAAKYFGAKVARIAPQLDHSGKHPFERHVAVTETVFHPLAGRKDVVVHAGRAALTVDETNGDAGAQHRADNRLARAAPQSARRQIDLP